MKICLKCNINKTAEEFTKNNSSVDKLHNQCKKYLK